MFQRHGGFEGGLHLPSRSAATAGLAIADLPAPHDVWIPLQTPETSPARLLVQVGRRVCCGECIAETEGGFCIGASIDGVITTIGTVDTARQLDVPAVQIVGATERGGIAVPGEGVCGKAPSQPQADSLLAVAKAVDRAGVTDNARPLGALLRAVDGRVGELIVSGLDADPILSGTAQLVFEHIAEIVRGAAIVRSALKAKHVWLVVDRSDAGLRNACRRACAGTPVRLLAVRHKYPQSHPSLLAKLVTRREPPLGSSPLAVGALTLQAATVLGVEAAVRAGQPIPWRVLTVTGPAIENPGHYRVPIGTRFRDILNQVGVGGRLARVIDGGLLTGRSVEHLDAVVTCETTGLVAIDEETDRIPNPGPCIRCGWCQDDCPVGLDPMLLLDAYERGVAKALGVLRPEACLECGLCSYVCPSELPLAEAVRHLKLWKRPMPRAERGASAEVSAHG